MAQNIFRLHSVELGSDFDMKNMETPSLLRLAQCYKLNTTVIGHQILMISRFDYRFAGGDDYRSLVAARVVLELVPRRGRFVSRVPWRYRETADCRDDRRGWESVSADGSRWENGRLGDPGRAFPLRYRFLSAYQTAYAVCVTLVYL